MSNEKDNLEVGLKAFTGLLNEFRIRNIANKKVVRKSLVQHLSELSKKWDEQFPGFPGRQSSCFSFIGLGRKDSRNAQLKKIIIDRLKSEDQNHGDQVIVTPACFIGRRERYLASQLRSFKVIATDINPRHNSFWRHFCRTPLNYEFQQDSIFRSRLEVHPLAVVFFGACGSLTDAAMDYFIKSSSPYLFCRTCCQQFIGGNIDVAKGFNLVNLYWRLIKPKLLKMLKEKKEYYFSPDYSMDQYPRSNVAKDFTNSDEFLKISRFAAVSGICRTIIDLDRFLYLVEHGYNVWYRSEMFIAEKLNVK